MKLKGPPSGTRAIRPTSDRAKEALFSILAKKVVGATVLDLYAGTGSLGFEALSRGSISAQFIDNNRLALSLLRINAVTLRDYLSASKISVTISIKKGDLPHSLANVFAGKGHVKQQFDIVFLDPPYAKSLTVRTLEFLDTSELLAEGAIVVAEDSCKTILPSQYQTLSCRHTRKYGDTAIWLYQRH